MEKVWNKEEIKENLLHKNEWVYRGVLAIYEKQTFDEQVNERTEHHNGVGFNGIDGDIMSSFAKQIIKWNGTKYQKFPESLSQKQTAIARKKIVKYSGQLAKIANKEL